MKRLLASILAVVLLGTMAISGFAAETLVAAKAEDEAVTAIARDIESGTAQEGTNSKGSKAQITANGDAVITVSDEDAEDGNVDVPIVMWLGSSFVAVLPDDVDTINLTIPFTPKTTKLGWGIVGVYNDPETDEMVILDNTFTDDDQIVLFDVPGDTAVTLVKISLINKAVDFTDVPEDAWYAKYIDYASAHGYIVGNGDGTVDPEGPISDAALYALLLRLAGKGEGTTGPDWDKNSRAAAKEAGFAIDTEGELTREQAIEIVSAFIGADAVTEGIFIGDEFGDLDLEGAFIRAHLAVISMRLVERAHGYSK